MKVATQSLYRPDDEAVLPRFVEYIYDFMAGLTELESVREKYVVDVKHARKPTYVLLKS